MAAHDGMLAQSGGAPANAAQLPPNHLAAGQPPTKLKEDLYSTANSIELFNEMLSPISPTDAADVQQVRSTTDAGVVRAHA